MKTRSLSLLLVIIFLISGIVTVSAQSAVTGLWKIIDDKTNKPTAITLLYMYQGKLYGRILATIDKDTGRIDDTINQRINRADKLAGNPPYCGIDFVYEMVEGSKEWRGEICDPEEAKFYTCRIWREGDKLIVRGQLKGLPLGRNQTWLKANPSDLPSDVIVPTSIVTVIPKKK
jgi:uncharacterized protein (DUF2147 family)